MAWVVDTCILLDVLEEDPSFGYVSAEILETRLQEGLVICPMTYAELSPAFQGDRALQEEFLTGVGADFREDWTRADTLRAHEAWNQLVQRRRSGQLAKRPLVDVLIGAFATRFQGLITRNPEDFARLFPSLPLLVPGA
jgi:predicted nucleic acid-binding protein